MIVISHYLFCFINNLNITLLEIILSISLIAVVSVTSFVGISFALKNIRINKLSDIEEDILTAAKIYLETNKEVSEQVYSKKNGVIISLNTLVNEGLLDLNGTDLKRNNIKDEYVYTSLSNSSSTSDDCIDLKTVTSWNESSSIPIYVCTKKDGSVNIQGSGLQANNISAVSREIYYPTDRWNTYVKYGENIYRLLYIDTDDSIVLYNNGTFGNVFDGKHLSILKSSTTNLNCGSSGLYSFTKSNNMSNIVNGETNCGLDDIYHLASCSASAVSGSSVKFVARMKIAFNGLFDKTNYSVEENNYSTSAVTSYPVVSNISNIYRKIRLKPCMKITGGSGDISNPYILEDKC